MASVIADELCKTTLPLIEHQTISQSHHPERLRCGPADATPVHFAYAQPLRSVCWSAGRGVALVELQELQLKLAEANSHGLH